MRRLVAFVSACVLVASVAASSVAAAPAAPKNRLVADFQAVFDGVVVGRVTAQLFEPSERQLVPGFYDFYGAGAPGWPIRESHAQLGNVEFWYDPTAGNPSGWGGPDYGANVAHAEGVICDYVEPNVPDCHPIYLWFVDVLDAAGRADYLDTNIVHDGADPWDGTSWAVGNGAFVLNYAGPTGS